MGIEAKHSYRFVYLKSEKWDTVRLEALARDEAKCCICGFQSISNDAHHINYPPSVWDTREDDLVILCRPCHNLAHDLEKLHIIKFSGNKAFSICRMKELCAALHKWKADTNWEITPEAARESVVHSQKLLSRLPNCYVCDTNLGRIERRKFKCCPAEPEKIGTTFCDDCHSYLDSEIPIRGLDSTTAPRLHKSIRAVVKQNKLEGKPEVPHLLASSNSTNS